MGADLVVRGAVALARRARVAPVVVALSVVAFGTSLPEAVVAVQASLARHPGLVLGNVVGSNIANVLLVAGVSAVLFPLAPGEGPVRRNGAIMLGASVVFALLAAAGRLDRLGGSVLLVGFVVIIALTARSTVRGADRIDPSIPMDWVLGIPSKLPTIFLFVAVGLVMLPLGADFLVDAGAEIASRFGVSDTFVGLTVIAVGTSFPELATSVLSALQKRSDVALGTIIGSNMFNVLAIMGVSGVLSPEPVAVSPRLVFLDLPLMLAASLMVLVYAARGHSVGRRAGVAFVAGYVVYLGVLVALA